MRNLRILIIVFGTIITSAQAQTILPPFKTFREKGKIMTDFNPKSKRDTSAAIHQNISLFMARMATSSKDTNALLTQHADSLLLQKDVDTLNQSSNVAFIATGGINNLENIKQSYGHLGIGLLFRLSKYKLTKNNWIDPHFVYVIFNAKTATSPDSNSILKTFLFPELNKRDFVLGYFWEFRRNDWSIAPNFEVSLNRNTDSSNTKTFLSQRAEKYFIL